MSKLKSATVTALLLSSSTLAFAQAVDRTYYSGATVADPTSGEFFVRDRYTAADNYYYEGIDPVPLRLGAFEARPALLLGAGAESNIFLDELNEVSDTFVVVEPSVSAGSTWSRHALGFDAAVRHEEYFDLSSESATQYGLRGFGNLDVSSNFAVAGSLSHDNSRETRTSVGGNVAVAERTEIERTGAEINAQYARNRIRLRGRIAFNDNDYSDVETAVGGIIDQDFRDHETTRVTLTAEYAVSRDWSLLGQVEQVERDYTDETAVINRDISGVIVRAGTSFELPVNLRGQVSAQYQDFDPDDPSLDTIEEFAADASVQWFPTTLTTVSAFASQSVSDAGNTGAANALISRYGVGLDHELLRTVVLSGEAYIENREFNPSAREDEQTVLDLGATWKLNPNIQVRGGYTFTTQDSDFNPFDDNTFTIALRLFP